MVGLTPVSRCLAGQVGRRLHQARPLLATIGALARYHHHRHRLPQELSSLTLPYGASQKEMTCLNSLKMCTNAGYPGSRPAAPHPFSGLEELNLHYAVVIVSHILPHDFTDDRPAPTPSALESGRWEYRSRACSYMAIRV